MNLEHQWKHKILVKVPQQAKFALDEGNESAVLPI